MRPVIYGLLVASLLAVVIVAVGAQSTPQFKSRTDLVEVAAIVTDRDGHPVTDLNLGDFEVEEDGKPVVVSTFAAIDSDLASGPAEGRFLVLLLDDVHPVLTARIKQIAHMFADRMSGNDVVAVLALNGGHHKTTTRKDVVSQQIDELKPYTLGMLASRVGNVCPECDTALRMGPRGGQAARSVGHALNMISSLSNQLSQVPHRRKTIVCIGDPALYATAAGPLGPIRAASRADVSVDVIDAGGLSPFDPSSLNNGSTRFRDGSIVLANETGGRAFLNTNFFERSVEKLWQDEGHYYLLGYVMPTAAPGRHAITVHVKRGGVDVRARKSRA